MDNSVVDYEFYETPAPFTKALLDCLADRHYHIGGTRATVAEPCVGSGAIVRAVNAYGTVVTPTWVTNDIDPRWPADVHEDAVYQYMWERWPVLDWTITNPPFTKALTIAERAIRHSRVGVAMHLRASIHEVLKTGPRRTWMAQHTPTGILWLPRFAYQRSRRTGQWTTDSVCACWCVWLTGVQSQFIEYASETVLEALENETPIYRAEMDSLMGYTGREEDRQAQCRRRWDDSDDHYIFKEEP